MKNLFLALTFLTFTTSTNAAVTAAAVAKCDQAQSKLLIQLNTAVSNFILIKAQRMNAFIGTTEKAAIAQCVYTSDSDQDFDIRLRGVKSRKVALRVMAMPANSGWNKLKFQTLQPLIASCTQSCSPVYGAAIAKNNCASMTESFDAIMELSVGDVSNCELTAPEVIN